MSEHEAGRELDALVAEKVMGCSPVKGTACHCGGYPNKHHNMSKQGYPHDPHANIHGPTRELAYYSTDIAAAWLVVEKFEYVQLEIMKDGVDCEIWKSTNRPFEEWTPVSTASADTAPLAICEAALAATEK
jgi:hypothetical protein